MHLLEMSDYTLPPLGAGDGIQGFHFALSPGEVCTVEAPKPDDSHQFLRAVATLTYPLEGTYRFMDNELNLKNYRELLSCKKKIGYIASDAALISNLTVRENMLIHRYYFENDLSIELDEKLDRMCDALGVHQKLDRRPADLDSMERQLAIVIREISKKPEVLLLDRPEDFVGHARFDMLVRLFNDWIDQRKPVVFVSSDLRLIRRFATRRILITNGSLTSTDMNGSLED
jgi:ABC-type molybdate transport system ATPase subunit